MPAQKKKKSINLLPQEEFAASTSGRILKWALTTFRIIVIVTEMIIMAAFLSRFWLDAKASDLNDEIKQKNAVIVASADFEKDFRKAQTKLAILSDLSSQEVSAAETLTTISSYLPEDTLLTSFTFISKESQIKGLSPSEQSIAQLMANLESVDGFNKVSLSQLDTTEETSLFSFTLKIELRKGGN